MKKWMKVMLACGILIGSASIPSWAGHLNAVHAAFAGTASQDQLAKDMALSLNRRDSSAQFTYAGSMAALKKDIKEAWNRIMNKDDYLHYIVKGYSYNATGDGDTAEINMRFTYWETLAETNEVKKRISQTLSRILKPGMNDHQKERAVHDWIVGHIAYDTSLVSHSAYDGLVKGKTVCQGYALITYEMMRQAGIPVKIVEGSSRGINHTWNLVQIGGKWYHVDTTWDDPTPDAAGRVVYNYYNLTDTQLRADHYWTTSAWYPPAVTAYDEVLTALAVKDSANAAFYKDLYEQAGYLYLTDARTAADLQSLTGKIRSAVTNRQQKLAIRYLKGATVVSDVRKAVEAQRGLSSYRYSYEDFSRTAADDKLIVIEFTYTAAKGKK
ncbi:transglutaminase domain-containing protein [Paenibacillus solisilvae]|uniref:Transglutaminase domain-containing protein n=1 Tax=Paenibacillus solisilvae TaxID=2486751 RepID=A0ABW0W424_9BACL